MLRRSQVVRSLLELGYLQSLPWRHGGDPLLSVVCALRCCVNRWCAFPVPLCQNVPASRGYTGGFGVPLMQKDLGLAADAAKSVNAPLPLGAAAYNLYCIMSNAGYSKKDFSAVYEFLAHAEPK
jgi:hypothetical protein